MRPRESLAAVLLAGLSASVSASVDPCPPATRQNILGIWEAVDLPQAFRVFRLELNSTGISMLTEGMPAPTYIPAFGSLVTSIELNDGHVLIEFKTVHQSLIGMKTIEDGAPYVSTGRSVFKGTARVCEESNGGGVLTGTLTLEPESRSPRVWTLTFFKSDHGTLVESIELMEKNAADLADKLRREEPVPPFPGLTR